MQFRRFNRREFITLVGGGAAAWPLAASAQQIGRVWRIGVLVAEPWPEVEGLHDGLRELGYRDGENVLLEYRFANGDAGRFPGLVADLLRLPVDVIVTWGTPATLAAIKATSSIPIIMSAGDPVRAGLVASLARPGANVTGFSSQTAGGEEKRLELLKELLPNLSRVVVLSNSTNPYSAVAVQSARRGAAALNIALDVVDALSVGNLDTGFQAAIRKQPDAALVIADPFLARQRALIAELMLEYRLPSIYAYHEHVVAGGLMAYMTAYYDIFRREAAVIDKIFKGAKAGDLPVEPAAKFELAINLKAARALGLNVPLSLLERANRVIE
jgi:putative tryptophan/tyrosine transport system substrate-binding protein